MFRMPGEVPGLIVAPLLTTFPLMFPDPLRTPPVSVNVVPFEPNVADAATLRLPASWLALVVAIAPVFTFMVPLLTTAAPQLAVPAEVVRVMVAPVRLCSRPEV